MDIPAILKKVEAAVDRMTWRSDTENLPSGIRESYLGSSKDGWVCTVICYDAGANPGYDGAAQNMSDSVVMRLTPELAKKACGLARSQLKRGERD